jgi:LacI family transcriptional regulator
MTRAKEITIYDLARTLNISVATVSRALKDDPVVSKKTKKKITDLAEQLGYRSNNFARNLRSQRTNSIGVIVPRLNSYFMSSVITGIESEANIAGYSLVITQSSESYEKEVLSSRIMFNNRVDGLLVSLAYDTRGLDHFDLFFKRKIPLIFFDRVMNIDHFPSITIDNKKAAYEATSHLINQGCKKIVHITAMQRRNVYVDRFLGYRQALSDNHIPFSDCDVIINSLSQEDGELSAQTILQMDPLPDAVFVANDNCAVGCMLALKQAGIIIPQQIAFAGFNNDPVSGVIEPNLTTVNYSGYEIGQVAARNLIGHLTGKSGIRSTDQIILRSELIVRQSSLKIKDK